MDYSGLNQYIEFAFGEKEVRLQFKGTPSFVDFIAKNADQSPFIKKSGKAKPLLMKIVRKALGTTEMPMTFKSR